MNKERFQHYRTFNDELDNSHYDLLSEMSTVADYYKLTYSIEPIKILARHLHEHHIEEENMMRSMKYPYIDFHIIAHELLRHELSKIIQRCKLHKFILNITHEFENLFISHIDNHDIQYSDWIKREKI